MPDAKESLFIIVNYVADTETYEERLVVTHAIAKEEKFK